MGAFFTNLQIRSTSTQAVCAALPKLTDSRAYVSPEGNGWVTVYLEATEDQNDKTLRTIAGGLSQSLQADVLGFLVHDSDIAAYWLFQNGRLTDEFDSAPDYFGARVDAKTRARVRGNTDILLPLCLAGTSHAQLNQVLHPADGFATFADETVTELAKLLGIDETRASLGFNYFDEEGAENLADVAEFEPVGRGAERKEAEPPGDSDVPPFPLPDSYPIAINMLTQTWNSQYDQSSPATAKMFTMFGKDAGDIMKQMRDQFDKSARDLLKKSTVSGLPTIEELKAARNAGPDALAALIAEKTPGQVTEIGIGAAVYGLEPFLAALLKHGLDPNAANAQGRTTLAAAEQHGQDSAIYRLVKNHGMGSH